MIHDIIWNSFYYTWRAIFYVLLLLPFAALGLIVEYMRRLKNKCLKRKHKKDDSVNFPSNQKEDVSKNETLI